MAHELRVGVVGEVATIVGSSDLATSYGSGAIEVFATPAMIALMEAAAADAVQALLPEGSITVGTRLDVTHSAATPAGAQVRARAALMQIDGRRLVFHVEAFDEVESIGQGTHERAIVDPTRLLARARAKMPRT